MKKRSVATSHAPLFRGLLEMGLREQGRFRQAGTRPQAAFSLGEPTGHFAAKRKVSEWVIYFKEVYDRARPGLALCIDIPQKFTVPTSGQLGPKFLLARTAIKKYQKYHGN